MLYTVRSASVKLENVLNVVVVVIAVIVRNVDTCVLCVCV